MSLLLSISLFFWVLLQDFTKKIKKLDKIKLKNLSQLFSASTILMGNKSNY
jgi:hypothetical protein